MLVDFAVVAAPKNQPSAFERKSQLRLMLFGRGFGGRVWLEQETGDEAAIVQGDLHIESALFKHGGEDHGARVGLWIAELLDFSELLRKAFEEGGRLVQRQRGAHLLVEIGL